MLDIDSPSLKSIKRIVILIIALALGLFIGGYLTYKTLHHQQPAAEEKELPPKPSAENSQD